MGIIMIVALLTIIAINCGIAGIMNKVATAKGYGKKAHVFAMCFWFGIVGYIYVAALPDLIRQRQNQQLIELMEKNNMR